MSDLITKVVGAFRWLIWWIDSLGFAFIDNAYGFMLDTMQGFNSEVVKDITGNLIQNAYVIVGIFALFRVAVTLINSIVNPDKLTDKKEGIGNVLFHFVGAIVLFIVVPLIFDLSREVQLIIIGGKTETKEYSGNYIPKLITGSDLTSNRDAGEAMQLIAVKALIRPDDEVATFTDIPVLNSDGTEKKDEKGQTIKKKGYKPSEECDKDVNCKAAVDAWNDNKLRTGNISNYISSYIDVGDDNVYVYHYLPFITLGIGIFMTYVLLSFTIDIAVRSVELVVLEILSPIFIITFVDPKMASSGPFSKWVKACTKSYLSLFIKVAIISLMLLLIANIDGLLKGMSEDSFFLKLLMIIAILIFAKKAPKWLGGMFGLDDGAGLGGLGIGKKLAGAALVGGLATKGVEAAKKEGKKLGSRTASRLYSGTVGKLSGRSAAKQNAMGEKSLRNIRQSTLDATGSRVKAGLAATKSFFNQEDRKARNEAINALKQHEKGEMSELKLAGKKGKMEARLQAQKAGLKGEIIGVGSLISGVKKAYDPGYKTHEEKLLSLSEARSGRYDNAFNLAEINKQRKLVEDCNLASSMTGQRCILADDGKGGKKIVYQSTGVEPVFDAKSLQKAYAPTTISWGDMAAFSLSGGNINATIAKAGLTLSDGTPIEVGSVIAKNSSGDYEVLASKTEAENKEKEIKESYSPYGQKEMEAVFAERKLQNAETYVNTQEAISNLMQAMSKLELDMSPVTRQLSEIVQSNDAIDEKLKKLNKQHDESDDIAERVKLSEEITQLKKQREDNAKQQRDLELQKASSDKYKNELQEKLIAFKEESSRYYNPDNPIIVKNPIDDKLEQLNMANASRLIESLRKANDKARKVADGAKPGNINKNENK